MNGKIRKGAIVAVLALVAITAIGRPVHAQTISPQYDRASYIPGDSGTLTISVVNNGGSPLEIRNITVYFPWAQLVNGKWPSPPPNVTNNLNPFVLLGSQSGGNNIYTWSTPFTVPGWYGGPLFSPSTSNCPDAFGPRYSTSYSGCIIVGISGNNPQYHTQMFSIVMALPTYTPTALQTYWFSIAEVGLLGAAAVLLAMVWNTTRRLNKK